MTAIRPKELRKPAGASGRPAAYCPQKSRPGGYAVGAQTFDFTKVFAADLPSPSGKWTGLAKYNFTGGNNDPPQIPLDDLVAAASNVLRRDRKSTRLNSSHVAISYAVFCLKKKRSDTSTHRLSSQ